MDETRYARIAKPTPPFGIEWFVCTKSFGSEQVYPATLTYSPDGTAKGKGRRIVGLTIPSGSSTAKYEISDIEEDFGNILGVGYYIKHTIIGIVRWRTDPQYSPTIARQAVVGSHEVIRGVTAANINYGSTGNVTIRYPSFLHLGGTLSSGTETVVARNEVGFVRSNRVVWLKWVPAFMLSQSTTSPYFSIVSGEPC